MVTTTRPISKDLSPMHSLAKQPKTRPRHRLSHGLQMDLKQAVQLEKYELKKLGLLSPSSEGNKALSLSTDEGNQVGLSPPCWLYHEQRRSLSFTTGQHGGYPPCSPPVPIPQRRYSAVEGRGEYLIHDVDAEELLQMSTLQCEGRLCHESWNYELAPESSKPLAVAGQWNERSRSRSESDQLALLKYRSESSMVSPTCTVNETDEVLDNVIGPEEEDERMLPYGGVFEMDEL